MPRNSDTAEYGLIMSMDRRRRRQEWHRINKGGIVESGIPFLESGECLLFRNADGPVADFYPSTGRWRCPRDINSGARSGGAKGFISWYRKQQEKMNASR